MIKIRNESDFRNWFKKNCKKRGFDKILRHDIGRFPDFIMERKGKVERMKKKGVTLWVLK
ncbi:MAG: hypothetical protein ABH864_01325 [archaeon]